MSTAASATAGSGRGSPATAGAREWAALAVLTLPVLLITIDMTVLGFAVPFLSEDLAPSGAQLLWIVDVYSFVLAGLLITMGTLGDRIGRRRLLLIGCAGFGAASLVAAYAPTAGVLIAARALLGVAGATLMPSTLSLIRNTFHDPRQRLMAIATWASMFSAGSALGPIVGGWLLERFHWGSVFLINVPVVAVALLVTPLLVRESRNPSPGRYDLASAALSLLAVLAVVYGVKTMADEGPSVTGGLAVALGLGVGYAFVRRQLRLTTPLIDLKLFAIREFAVGVATNFTVVFTLISSLFFLTQYLQLVQGISPMRAGLLLVPGLSMAVVMHFVAVALARRLRMGTVIVIGLALAATGYAMLTTLPMTDGAVFVGVGFGLIGMGAGVTDTLTNDAIMSAAPPSRAGAASAVSETAYELGAALGVALLGSVVTAMYRTGLESVPGVAASTMAEARETLGGAVSAAQEAPQGAAALLNAARAAFTDGVQMASLIATVLIVAIAVHAGIMLRRRGQEET
ncbi:MFS transporter [Salinactinospora qingdaonensis]|uniref:Efflux MFS transporter LfrA n=1 Tax=Salinactinospora qingdaonensis TaxID=702744 RepID=A0ABP7FXQ8_9ACTN